MNLTQSVMTIDAHTAGTPIRVVVNGIPTLFGDTISQRMEYMKKHHDNLRCMVSKLPRGSQSLVCAILTEPTVAGTDFGLFYFDADTYQPMCGAGTLSVAKVVVETGMVKRTPPETKVVFETATGIVHVSVKMAPDGSTEVIMTNAPAFRYEENVLLNVPELGDVLCDVYFGGNFFTLVDVAQFGFTIKPSTIPLMIDYKRKIIAQAQKSLNIEHPLNPDINYIDQCLFIQNEPEADGAYLNQCVFGDGLYDISPCGTGTCARLAQRYNKGFLRLHEPFKHRQAFGGEFIGLALEAATVAGKPGVVPQIQCTDVHITAMNNLVAEESDRLRAGFETW